MLDALKSGGFIMLPLILCSLVIWVVIFERFFYFRKVNREFTSAHLELVNAVLKGDDTVVRQLCSLKRDAPSMRLAESALERLTSKDLKVKDKWVEGVERKRQVIAQEMKKNLWILGTIANSSPFIGLFGTVVGILKSFGDLSKSQTGGFTVVASGISEALVATAAGILVAVISSLAYNIFQTRLSQILFQLKLQAEEVVETFSMRNG